MIDRTWDGEPLYHPETQRQLNRLREEAYERYLDDDPGDSLDDLYDPADDMGFGGTA